MLPILVLRSASSAAPGLRLEPAIVHGAATRSAMAILALRLFPVSVIVRTALLFVASSSVRESKLERQMVLLLAIARLELLSVEWFSVQASMLQPQRSLASPTSLQMEMASPRPMPMKLAFRNLEKPRSLSQRPLQIF